MVIQTGNFGVVRDIMRVEIASTIQARGLKQAEAARVCGTDAASFSKALRGKSRQVSIEKLAVWLSALGRSVTLEIGDGSEEQPQVAITLGRSDLCGEVR